MSWIQNSPTFLTDINVDPFEMTMAEFTGSFFE